MNAFLPANILLPKTDHMEKWAVIACDQFTSDQAYWDRVRKNAEGAVSTINLILPEAELGTEKEAAHTAEINATMKKYMEDGVFTEYPNSFIYVERTLENGSIREGLVGMVDLDTYDYNPGATSAIRATERTVPERIPPRQRVRRDAPIELPHVLMLCDDHDKKLIEPIGAKKDSLKKVYDFDLMEGGGHITGWLVEGKDVDDFNKALTEYSATVGEKYTGLKGTPMVFAVGDGNHSLATAKSCYEELKAHGVKDENIVVTTVPGALEIPGALVMLYEGYPDLDALVAIGCVIRGETYHFELVANESSRGVTDFVTTEGISVANCILTVENEEQAKVRVQEKGADAARVALEMGNLRRFCGRRVMENYGEDNGQ